MAKDKVTSETETKQENTISLGDYITELYSIEDLINAWVKHELKPDKHILLLLTRCMREKIDYLHNKYNFRIEMNDWYFVEDMLEFARKLPAKTE